MLAGNPNVLFSLMEQHGSEPVGIQAALVAGDYLFSQAVQLRFTNRAAANESLARASDCYKRVLAVDASPMAKERANFGLARVLEADNKLAEAADGYKTVTEQWPHGEFAVWASRRLADLEKPATKEFYDQFARFDPKPSAPAAKCRASPRFPSRTPCKSRRRSRCSSPANGSSWRTRRNRRARRREDRKQCRPSCRGNRRTPAPPAKPAAAKK